MANVRDSDTSLWLHNKLGTSNDSWTGGSICSQLNAEVLRNIKDCFPDLQTQVKLKLLLSFFHIPRRNVDEWRVELEEILEVAQMDSEPWVSMLAEIMKTLPGSGSLNSDIREIEENKRIFSDLVNDLKKLVKKKADLGMLPLECHYLSKPALLSLVGQQPAQVKHFTLKRKPKSAALRAELLQKSTDVQNSVKKGPAPTIPLRSRGMPRKVTDTTPLKGIPSRVPTGGFRSPPLTNTSMSRTPLGKSVMKRKDGGIKLLDINEQPMGYAQAKKRKRMQELEDAKKASEEAALKAAESSATPEYAVGLTSLNPPTPVASGQSVIREIVSTTPMPPLTPVTPSTPVASSTAVTPSSIQEISTATVIQTNASVLTPLTPVSPAISQSTPPVPDLTPLQTVQTPNGTPAQVIIQRQQGVTQYRIAQPTLVTTVPNQQQSNLRRGLSLTREQMLEAQEMFRVANKVTRPEKALILGFMAGSRENPCPHLGNIVTIKLSENQENVLQTDGTYLTMMVETHFQMNYSTGEWKRIRKLRKIDESMVIPIQSVSS
ncbi:Negative elongation factor A, putative [Pediculus humanus corporis]|uniref:Negative elongation factor A, putative n=1 Tax=Pediculus humanus subsp. corporis TaxID=121224 RepID=E0VTK9_PEDHC|nr:Negative elongation factor A, putative [Pediculus humanus corporis]EEB16736.1 Negative elongation factor A, putative [Pediculus humanus corporis]